jgi:hypothetical protein
MTDGNAPVARGYPVTAEPCDRAETIIQRAINCRWIEVLDHEQLRANFRIALDTEVAAGGPYLNNGWNSQRGNYEDRHPNDMVLHPLSEIREWDEALAVLGIQDSDQTPADAIRELNAEIERLRDPAQSSPRCDRCGSSGDTYVLCSGCGMPASPPYPVQSALKECASRCRYDGDLFHDQGNIARRDASWKAANMAEDALSALNRTKDFPQGVSFQSTHSNTAPLDWQNVDTAPQDGRTIEVRFLTDNPRRVRWSQSDRGTYWHLADSVGPAMINFSPTEWRPSLPSTSLGGARE